MKFQTFDILTYIKQMQINVSICYVCVEIKETSEAVEFSIDASGKGTDIRLCSAYV